ncbi:hypothetical protein [Pseudomonas ovata]|uniref:hypothetical protein n=1 Tax=Pseudomonas ovata TaxID=1839709 RepID=UPI000D69668A|nr:hypothetical protein [Pseudomonas ovata]
MKLANGDVVCVPYTAANIAIYRWRSNTLYTVPAPVAGAKFRGGALAPDGRVVFAPNTYDKVGWYDPTANAYGEGATLGMGTASKFAGAVQNVTGEIVFTPYANENTGIFKAVTAGALPAVAMQSVQWNKS